MVNETVLLKTIKKNTEKKSLPPDDNKKKKLDEPELKVVH